MNTTHRTLLRKAKVTILGAVAASAALLGAVPASLGQPAPATRPAANADSAAKPIALAVGKTSVLNTDAPFKRVSVAQPDIADVNAIGPKTLLVTAKKAGATQVIVWDDAERSQVLDIVVSMDLAQLQDQLKRVFPEAKLTAESANGAIVLRGRVPSAVMAEQASMVAAGYGKVLNFVEVSGGQQVMLQVRFAEVSRSATSALGVNFGFGDGTGFGGSNIGQVSPMGIAGGTLADSALSVVNPSPAVTLFGKARIGDTTLTGFLNALRQNNLMRMLAEPNLIAISGQEASFLAGGEFPVPVTQGGGTDTPAISVEYREFGVKLKFVPIVMGDGRIRLEVAPEVSDLDFTTAVRFNGFVIPGLTTRKVQTTIELAEGQTFAIAGLLNNSVSASKDVTPILGDLPVVGALFRSVRYQRKETELVVLVTPRLVEAMNPDQIPALPGETWRHPTDGELFLNQDLGGPAPDRRHAPTTRASDRTAPVYRGQVGFTPVTATDPQPPTR